MCVSPTKSNTHIKRSIAFYLTEISITLDENYAPRSSSAESIKSLTDLTMTTVPSNKILASII